MAKITTSFSQQLRQSRMVAMLITIIGLFVGLWLCINAGISLMTYEPEAIYQAKILAEGKNAVISVDVDQVDMSNENKLIHITGETIVDEIILDKLIKIEVTNVIKLRRIVQVYQWQEDAGQNYDKVWSEQFIDSKKFHDPKHNNPTLPFTSRTFIAKQVILGDFVVPNSIVDKMNHYQKLPMKGLWQEQENLRTLLPNNQLHFSEGDYYIGKNPAQPKIGDLKLSFMAVLPENISIITKQAQLQNYKPNTDIELFEYGLFTSDRMFRNARVSLFIKNLTPRLESILAIFIGIYIIFNILWIASPSLLNPNDFRVWWFALIVAISLALAVIAFNWHAYNSMVGKVLFIIAISILYLLKFSYKPQALVLETTVPQKMD